jgi:ribosomal protein S21
MASNLIVGVYDNNVEWALKKLKKACLLTGLLKEMKAHESYMKPSVSRRLKSTIARRKERKRMLHTAAWEARYERSGGR